MPITTADQYFAAARRRVGWKKTAARTTVAAQMFSLLDIAGQPGAGSLDPGNIANGRVPTDAIAGFPTIPQFGGGVGYLNGATFRNSVPGGCILYDRLFDVGRIPLTALATTTLAAQPSFTSRLPNGDDYGDCELLLEVNTTVSATATTVAVNYNNHADVGESTTALNVSGLTVGRVEMLTLAANAKFPKRINSVTVGGTVASAGFVNVILARKIAEFDIAVANRLDPQGWDFTGGPQMFEDMALWPVVIPDGTSSGLPRLSCQLIYG
jgi:hypothetical protein